MRDDRSDAELLAAYARQRDQAAFAALVHRHAPMVRQACLRHLSAADADDAMQTVFIILSRKAEAVPRADALAGWLYRTARRVVMHLRREQSRRRRRELAAAAQPAEPAAVSDDEALLHDGIAALPRRLQDAVVLRYFEGRSLAETAAALGCAEEAAKKRLSRALAALRAHFARRGVSEAALAPLLAAPSPEVPSPMIEACVRAPSAGGRPAEIAAAVSGASAAPVAVIVLAIVAVAVAASFLWATAPRPRPPADPPVVAPIPDPEVTVCWRRDDAADALRDLSVQSGLWYALPDDAARSPVSLEREGLRLHEALDAIAAASGLACERSVRADGRPLAVFRRRCDEAALTASLADAAASEVARRRGAVMALARLTDARAVSALARLATDPERAVAAIARRELAERGAFATRLPRIGLIAFLAAAERATLLRAVAPREGASMVELRDALGIAAALGDAALARQVLASGPADLAADCADALAASSPPAIGELARMLPFRRDRRDIYLNPRAEHLPSEEAARALSALHSEPARTVLRRELRGDRAGTVAWGVSECVDPGLVPELIAVARDPDINTRIAATCALARSHDPAALQACRGYDDHFTRQYLADAHDPSIAALADDPRNADLVARLRAPGTAAKLIAWCQAGSIGPDVFRQARDQEAADWLVTELEAAPETKAPTQNTRAMLLEQALASLPDPAPVLPRLCGILRAASRDKAGWMARELWECARGDARWLDAATTLADAGVSLALLNLGDMRDPRATAALIAHRPTSREDLDTYCLALENDASPAAVAEFIALLDHAEPRVREAAARSLAPAGDPIAVPAVERAFARVWAPGAAASNTAAAEEQFAVAYALAVLDGEAALPQLLPRVGQARMLRFTVAHACARPEPLLEALPEAKDPAARAAIVDVLRSEFSADARVAALPDPPEPKPGADAADAAPQPPANKAGDF